MADAIFEHPRLAAIYDALDPDRRDLTAYVAMAHEFGAGSVLDVGCGTGTLALMLADSGIVVVAADPAAESLRVATAKPGAQRVRWLGCDASALPPLQVDLAVLTGNAAQAIIAPTDWSATLRGIHDALHPEGRLVFETRDPTAEAWTGWTREQTHTSTDIETVGAVESWCELLEVSGGFVSFRWTWLFHRDGMRLTADSTLRFRGLDELHADLGEHGYRLDEVRDAADRPGLEFVVVASPT